MGGTARGFVRGSALVPRDSTNVALWTLDHSGALLSPNDDGVNDRLVVAARFSEPVASTLTVRNAAGSVVKGSTISDEIAIHAWNLDLSSGAAAPDGKYTWTLKAAGHPVDAQPRYMMYRTLMLNHLVHHRAQLGFYLRLTDQKVPQMYGPTADEKVQPKE